MRLNPPKKNVWWIALALGAVGIVAYVVSFFTTSWLSIAGFVVVLAGLVLLLLANVLTGL